MTGRGRPTGRKPRHAARPSAHFSGGRGACAMADETPGLPDWIRLLPGVAIMMQVRGVDTDAAKAALRAAMVDQRVHVRLVERVEGKPVYHHIAFPADLILSNDEWQRSGPENPLRMAS
jgi:hypothetical protein